MAKGYTTKLQEGLDLLAQGKPGAKDLIIEHSCERLRGIASRMLRKYPAVQRWAQTDDVLQEALVRLRDALGAVTPASPEHFHALAAQHLRWELLSLARKYSGREGIGRNHDTDPNELHIRKIGTLDEPASWVEWIEFLEQIDKLSKEDQRLFDLLWRSEFTQEKAAEILGISLSSVKRRWMVLLDKLADILGDDDENRR